MGLLGERGLTRRFTVGHHGEFAGIDWRVVRGRKAPDDLRLEFRAMEFQPVSMSLGFLMADFFCENEDVLFPPEQGFEGGGRYARFCRGAVLHGWPAAVAQLEDEKKRAALRRAA
jgi:hypothetical protein